MLSRGKRKHLKTDVAIYIKVETIFGRLVTRCPLLNVAELRYEGANENEVAEASLERVPVTT